MRTGGRPRQLEVDDIVEAGRRVGLDALSMNAVAQRLGVSTTALYRYVASRWELERLVGESILSEFEVLDDPDHGAEQHLLSFALQLYDFVLDHPGLAAYLQTLFPRGEGGRRIVTGEIAAMGRRGYDADAALVVTSAVASSTIGYAAAEERQRGRETGYEDERRSALAGIAADSLLQPAHTGVPDVDMAGFVRLVMPVVIDGLVRVAPAGRPVAEVIAELEEKGRGV